MSCPLSNPNQNNIRSYRLLTGVCVCVCVLVVLKLNLVPKWLPYETICRGNWPSVVFLNDGQVGSLILSESWLVKSSGPAFVYCAGPDWMIWFVKSDGLDCLRQRKSEMGREKRRETVKHKEKMIARWNLRARKMNGLCCREKYIQMRETKKERERN